MKKIIFDIVLSLFVVSNCYGHSFNGSYVLDGYYNSSIEKKYGSSWEKGNIVIDGNKFFLETRDNGSESYGLCLKNGIIKDSGNSVKVYDGHNYVFDIHKRGNSIKLIPKNRMDIVIKLWNGTKFVIDEEMLPGQIEWIRELVPELKWKKVK